MGILLTQKLMNHQIFYVLLKLVTKNLDYSRELFIISVYKMVSLGLENLDIAVSQ